MKRIISLVLALLLTISSLQVCFASESYNAYPGYPQSAPYPAPSFTIYNNSSSSSSNGNFKLLLALGLGLLLWFKHKTILNNLSNFSTNFTSKMSEGLSSLKNFGRKSSESPSAQENSTGQANSEESFVNIVTLLSSFGTSLKTFFQKLFLGKNYNQESSDFPDNFGGYLTDGEDPTCSAHTETRDDFFNFPSITTIFRTISKIVQIPFLALHFLIPKVLITPSPSSL